jgi:NADH-quinone oxidoreductase subunit E
MLTQEEITAIDDVLPAFPEKRNAAIDALRIVQGRRGWISDDSLADIAGHLGMSTAQLDDVATFYNRVYRSPVGKHVILICDSVSCWIMDERSIRDHLLASLGLRGLYETTADGLFTVLPASCLGACDRAPVMMVDDILYCNLTCEKIDGVLGMYRKP